LPEQLTTEKEKSIVEAARKRFAYYGFSKVTMDEIAADVGMGKASLYYYFPTKESIFKAVIVHEQNQFIADIQTDLKNCKSSREKLMEYAERRLALFRDLVNLSSLTYQQASEVKSVFKELFSNLEKEELGVLDEIIRLGMDTGEFTTTGSQQTAETILHALHGLRLRSLRGVGGRLDDNAYSALINEMHLLMELILRGLTSGKKSS
jgi:TetR/AcrR family transcriptional regulator